MNDGDITKAMLDTLLPVNMEQNKFQSTGKCPIRTHNYDVNGKIPLCKGLLCSHILLEGETECPCHMEEVSKCEHDWKSIGLYQENREHWKSFKCLSCKAVKAVNKPVQEVKEHIFEPSDKCETCGIEARDHNPIVTSNPTSGRDWEERFDKLADKNTDWNCGLLPSEIKSFIKSELDRVREENQDELDAMLRASKRDVAQARLDTLREIEKLVEDVDQGVYGEAHDGLNLLKQKLEDLK